MKRNKYFHYEIVLTVLYLISFLTPAHCLSAPTAKQIEQQKADIRKMADVTLERLYTTQPSAKRAIGNAAGYAVFSNFGLKIFFAGGGSGKGLAVNNKTQKTTFMKMIEVQAGLGLGIKKFRLIWVFENPGDLNSFINAGWEFGGQATVAAQASGEGAALAGAMSIKPGVWLYQLTDDGLAAELTAKGTKYYKDQDLN
jgi:lipid-binding SYLF domain-containing protein